jgi:hypothetical protein
MRKSHFVTALRLALVFAALLFAGVGHGRAQSPKHHPSHQEKTMTDAAGRVHVRREHNNFAQRKTAARERVKALRKAAMQKKVTEVKK